MRNSLLNKLFSPFGSLAGNPGETHEWATVEASDPGHGLVGGGPPACSPGATQLRRCTLQQQNTPAREGAVKRACSGARGFGCARRGGPRFEGSYLVDPASSHMLVSKIKPCMSKYKLLIL